MSAYMYYEYNIAGSWKSIRKIVQNLAIIFIANWHVTIWLVGALSVLLLNMRWKSIISHIILKFMLLGGENVVTNCR